MHICGNRHLLIVLPLHIIFRSCRSDTTPPVLKKDSSRALCTAAGLPPTVSLGLQRFLSNVSCLYEPAVPYFFFFAALHEKCRDKVFSSPPPLPPHFRAGNYKLQDTQNQVDEVVGIMRGNIEKVLERDSKLSDLEDKSGTSPLPSTVSRLWCFACLAATATVAAPAAVESPVWSDLDLICSFLLYFGSSIAAFF